MVLDHTADIKLKVVGTGLEELFLQALEGLAHLLYHNYNVSGVSQTKVPIRVSSIDVNSLLVDFLSEVLYQSDIHQSVFFRAKIKKFTNCELEAELSGRPIHQFDRHIKAVTYQDVRILKDPEGLWQTEIIFDV